MAYPTEYWFELVRSSSNTALVEDAAGSSIWLRTSDGEPLEQQRFQNATGLGAAWTDELIDTDEPDLVGSANWVTPWRGRKTGETWLPSDSGIAFVNIPWNGRSAVRYGPGYFPGYWAELVRSASSWSLAESATGRHVWLRTSDGEPLDVFLQAGSDWFRQGEPSSREPSSIYSVSVSQRTRYRKSGSAWLPNANGVLFSAIPWNGASTYRLLTVPDTTTSSVQGGIKIGTELIDFNLVGDLKIGTEIVGGIKIASDIVYKRIAGTTPSTPITPPPATPTPHHTFTIVAAGAGSVGYNRIANTGTITSGTFTTPSNKAVSVTHTRNVGTELNFALTGPNALTATDFPTSIKVTKTTGGEVSLTLEPQAGSLRQLSGGGTPANTWRQDYDPTSGSITSVFVSGQTIRVELYY